MKSIIYFFVIFSISQIANAQTLDPTFFDRVDQFLQNHVQDGLVNYQRVKNSKELTELIGEIAEADVESLSDETKQAFYINAYNLYVINQTASHFPVTSVQDIPRFFDGTKVPVAKRSLTLNTLEKELLLKPYQDARFHFVLVCGALGCPPITDFAYRPKQLEQQLDQQTTLALNNDQFIWIENGSVSLSQIFKWYLDDFGGSKKSAFNFINKYRKTPINLDTKVSYYPYDWSLNDLNARKDGKASVGNNASRYIVSSTIPKGTFELKLFNNLYSQRTGSEGSLTDRSSFFTSSLSVLYGINSRFNLGFITRFRRVRNDRLPSSQFDVFSAQGAISARSGITAFGPQIRYAPVKKWANFSIQSSIAFPIGSDLSGNSELPYIDWDGITWNTQFFNDFSIGTNFSLFTEIDLLFEDIGRVENGHANRVSTPATLIFSYNPNRKTTLYTLAGFSPFWQAPFDYFIQGGLGLKYQFTPKVELELLVTDFTNRFLANSGGQATTSNLGLRFNF